MKHIQTWQQELSDASGKKFPDNKKWSDQDRILSIMRQVAAIGGAVQKEQGLYQTVKHEHQNANHWLGILVSDILILCAKRKVNVEKELQLVLDWFNQPADK